MSIRCAKLHPLTHTQSPPSTPPQPTASDDDSDGWYSAPEEQEELVEHYPCTSPSPQTVPGPHTRPLLSPSPPTRPGDLTSTDESGSLCPTVESLVRLEPLGPGTCEELWLNIIFHVILSFSCVRVNPH